MPKTKKTKAPSTSESDSDSGPDDRNPPAKKSKPADKPTPSKEQEEESWDLGTKKFVKLSEFKGTWYVNIREFYMAADGDMKPTKKGIMLKPEQWRKLKESVDDIDAALKKHV